VNVHAKSRLILETSAGTPVRDQGPGGSLPGPDAGHPLHRAGGHDDEDQGDEMPGVEPRMGATLGATGTNDFPILWTHLDSRQGRAPGHGLFRTGPDTSTGTYGSERGRVRIPPS
jgi:hypothetical protein